MKITCNLKNINIENLYSEKSSVPYTNGKLDVNTLLKSNVRHDFTVDPRILLQGKKKRQQTLDDCYISIYKNCWDTIVQADKSGITDIVFELSEPSNCVDFSSSECLNIIEKNLLAVSKNGIKCVPISEKRLFITWHNIDSFI